MSADNFRLAATVITHGLNVHYMPGSEKLHDAVPRGTKVTVTRYEQRPKRLWAYVEIPSRHEFGWVWADCLTFDPPAELPRIELPEVEPIVSVHTKKWLVAIAVAIAVLVSAYSCAALAADLTLADPALTPGAVTSMSLRQICKTRWGTDRRFVTAAMKRQVFASYGLTGNDDPACAADKSGRHCEIDHKIPRSLGGKDDVKNLSPMPFGTSPWNAARKDRLEAALSRDVCAGKVTLARARTLIGGDYRIEYRRRWGVPGK